MVVNRQVLVTLILISVLGVIAIPFGSPKFVGEAIIIELSLIALSVLIWRGYTRVLYACIALASLVIIGNTTSPAHMHLMLSFSKPVNASILIAGGYVLSGLFMYTSLKALIRIKSCSLTQSSASYNTKP